MVQRKQDENGLLDRMLIAQAQAETMSLVSSDSVFSSYEVTVIQ